MTRLRKIETWLNAVWGEGRLDQIEPLFVKEAQAGGIMEGLSLGPREFLDLVPAFRAHVRDLKITILRSFENPDWVWTLLRVEGFARASGAPINTTGQLAMRFVGDKVAEAHNSFDAITIFEQLELLPPGTVALCLSGERLE